MPLETTLQQPEADLFYRREEPDDCRMGEIVDGDLSEYDKAEIVIVGYPEDEGVRRNKGRVGAADGPTKIRRSLYKLPAPFPPDGTRICDVGDIRPTDTLEETQKLQQTVVRDLLQDGKVVVVLGGGNDVSFADVSALHEVVPDLLAFNIDSHFDVRESDRPHSGTPYRQLLNDGKIKPHRFYEMAGKPETNSQDHRRFLLELGVNVYYLDSLREHGMVRLFRQVLRDTDAEGVFWGFDLDSVRSSDAPGVSAPYPVGLTAEEICEIAEVAGAEPRTRILEIAEMNPRHDVDNRTAMLAGMAITRFLRSFHLSRGRRRL